MPSIKDIRKFNSPFQSIKLFFYDQKQNSDNTRNYKHFNIDEIETLIKLNDKYSLFLFHINACPFSKKKLEDLECLLELNDKYLIIDYIFSIILSPDSVPGNLTAIFSDHLS